jgi:aspartate-semialdehyde dehydrogenase
MTSPVRIPVAVLGATGLVGQHFVARLARHPWLELREIVGSPRACGARYASITRWALDAAMPECVEDLRVQSTQDALEARILFSALPATVAREVEPEYANRGHLVATNASAMRREPGVPLIVPDVNPHAIDRVVSQPWYPRGGGIIANPNCVVAGLSLALAPLHRAFGIEAVTVVTLQAVSGAGLSGLGALAALGNVIPHIDGEVEKIQWETTTILDAAFPISACVNRVPIREGHSASVFVRLRKDNSLTAIVDALRTYRAEALVATLPSTPSIPIVVHDAADRPRPIQDVMNGNGMAVTVGGIAHDPVYHVRFSLLVHNLVRGAAGGSLLNAELAVATGMFGFQS